MATLAAAALGLALVAACNQGRSADPTPSAAGSGPPITTSAIGTSDTPSASTMPSAGTMPSTSTPAAPAVPADVPKSGRNLLIRDEKPPVMALIATTHTAAGAEAFAVFFVKTIDWGCATTSSAYMRHYFASTCDLCLRAARDLDKTVRLKHHYLGDRFKITATGSNGVEQNQHGSEYVVSVKFDVTAFSSVDSTGKIFGAGKPVKDSNLDTYVKWESGGWRVAFANRTT